MLNIRIDYLDNPELQMALMNKEPGEECELTVKLSTISANEESLEGSVEEVIYEYDGEEMSIEPSTEEPIGIDMFDDIDIADEDEEDEEADIDMEVEITPESMVEDEEIMIA